MPSTLRVASISARWLGVVASALGLAACGGSSSSGSTPPPPTQATYTLGGTVNGAAGAGLVLANNGATVTVAAGAASFTFPNALTTGTAYAVTVQGAPNGQTCTVAGGAGTMGTANIANVVVTCSDQSYTLGGTITGLSRDGLVLANGTDRLTVPAGTTSFTMPAAVAFSSSYQVTVQTQPTGLSCSVQNGTGTMGAANVTNIMIACTDQPYTIGGTISGLTSGSVTLANGADTVQINASANASTFTFPTQLYFGSSYAVTVATQPVGMTCSVASGSGTVPAGNVNTVVVTCSDQSYPVGGTISGLTSAGLVLTLGSQNLIVGSTQTSFQFAPIPYMSTYQVTVTSPPTGQTCTVGNDLGVMGAGAVTNVTVTCSAISYTVGGSITGLNSMGLILTDGTHPLTVFSGANSFTMPVGFAYNSSYSVSVQASPIGASCVVTSNTGTVTADVTNIQVTCTPFVWTWEAGANVIGDAGNGALGTPTATSTPSARQDAMTWRAPDGKLWLFGGSPYNSNISGGPTAGDIDDVWSYDPSTFMWTWVSGSNTLGAAPNYGPGTLTPGARHGGAVWVDSSGRAWLFGGQDNGGNVYADLWSYDTTLHVWTYVGGSQTPNDLGSYGSMGTAVGTNLPPARADAAHWIDSNGKLWLFGGLAWNGSNPAGLSDLWKYDPGSGLWTWENGSNATDAAGVYGQLGQISASNQPGARAGAAAWVDSSGNLWLFGGASNFATAGVTSNDLWIYNTVTNQWAWMGGSSTPSAAGVYGNQGTGATTNVPGARAGSVAWTDNQGRFWLFAGGDIFATTSFNDLWSYDPATAEWTWVRGSKFSNTSAGVYPSVVLSGTATSQPSSRYQASGWTDLAGHLWLFGGAGWDSTDAQGRLNDLWKF